MFLCHKTPKYFFYNDFTSCTCRTSPDTRRHLLKDCSFFTINRNTSTTGSVNPQSQGIHSLKNPSLGKEQHSTRYCSESASVLTCLIAALCNRELDTLGIFPQVLIPYGSVKDAMYPSSFTLTAYRSCRVKFLHYIPLSR